MYDLNARQEIAQATWFKAGLTLDDRLRTAYIPDRTVWILPPEEARGFDTIGGIPVRVVDGVTPHLAFELTCEGSWMTWAPGPERQKQRR